MYTHRNEEIPTTQLRDYGWKLVGDAKYKNSVYYNGVVVPLFLATWQGKLSLVGGNRRVLSLLAAYDMAKEDGTLDVRPWLWNVMVVIFEDVPPDVQTAWALLDNAERSNNPLKTYELIMEAQDRGDWDDVTVIYKLNRVAYEQAMEFGKLKPYFLDALRKGDLSKGNALAVARMGVRQDYLEELVKNKRDKDGFPDTRVTGNDIKAAKEARATAVLQVISSQLVPQQQATAILDKPTYLAIDDAHLDALLNTGYIFTSFNEAFEASQADSRKVYKLVRI